MNEVAAVVVTYNRKDLLRRNIGCLLAQEGASCDVLIFDNASTDGTREMVENEFGAEPRVIYENTGSNLGGAGGFQYGINAAVLAGYQYVWVMDDDCLPEPSALASLIHAGDSLDGEWGWLCSAVCWTDGSVCAFNRPKRDVFRHIRPDDYEKNLVPAMMTSFVSVMFRSDVIRELGLPIAEYFIWTDDYEFTGRISKQYPCYAVPPSKVVHHMKENARPSLATVEEDRIERFYYLSRNDVHCYRQHGFPGRAYLVVKRLYTAIDIFLHAKDHKSDRFDVLRRGYSDGNSFNPAVPLFEQ